MSDGFKATKDKSIDKTERTINEKKVLKSPTNKDIMDLLLLIIEKLENKK